ncbi:MAG: aspartate aminotransferase family protein [Anaerolineae bacterium]|jgi:4-aminobutyrate aminotransferase|nr:aspartate aminotransferase family protein [Anaerolineae bacterium]
MTMIPNSNDVKLRIHQNLAPSLAEDWPMLMIDTAQGAYLHTIDGKEIMDFTSGIGVTNLGHNHPKVINAAIEQMKKIAHSAIGIVMHEAILQLTEVLPTVMPSNMEMFFFGNSGAEAVEGALKLARYVTGRQGIIAFTGGFHGRTYGAASVTSIKSKYRKHYHPLVPGIYFAEYANPYRCPIGNTNEKAVEWSVESIHRIFKHFIPPEEVAAILVEPVQGEGGYLVPPKEFHHQLRKICDQHGILLIFDEVQTGFGRTGEMFGAQTFGVEPDILAVAKAIANGFPLGATVSSRKIMSQWLAGSHGTTFGGNPVACAAALAVQEVFAEENILNNAKARGQQFFDGLVLLQQKHDFIGDVRGIGMMLALEIVKPDGKKTPDPETAMKILNGALDAGLLGYMAGPDGQVVRFIPPLIVTEKQIDHALEILEVCLRKIENHQH